MREQLAKGKQLPQHLLNKEVSKQKVAVAPPKKQKATQTLFVKVGGQEIMEKKQRVDNVHRQKVHDHSIEKVCLKCKI